MYLHQGLLRIVWILVLLGVLHAVARARDIKVFVSGSFLSFLVRVSDASSVLGSPRGPRRMTPDPHNLNGYHPLQRS